MIQGAAGQISVRGDDGARNGRAIAHGDGHRGTRRGSRELALAVEVVRRPGAAGASGRPSNRKTGRFFRGGGRAGVWVT
jgi:hypothetical protein